MGQGAYSMELRKQFCPLEYEWWVAPAGETALDWDIVAALERGEHWHTVTKKVSGTGSVAQLV